MTCALLCSLFFVKFTVLLTCATTLIPGRKFANLIKRELQAHTVSYCCYKTLCTYAEKTNILLVQRQQPVLPEEQSIWKQTSHFQTETRDLDLPALVFPEHSGCASRGNLHTIKAAVYDSFWWHLNFYFLENMAKFIAPLLCNYPLSPTHKMKQLLRKNFGLRASTSS